MSSCAQGPEQGRGRRRWRRDGSEEHNAGMHGEDSLRQANRARSKCKTGTEARVCAGMQPLQASTGSASYAHIRLPQQRGRRCRLVLTASAHLFCLLGRRLDLILEPLVVCRWAAGQGGSVTAVPMAQSSAELGWQAAPDVCQGQTMPPAPSVQKRGKADARLLMQTVALPLHMHPRHPHPLVLPPPCLAPRYCVRHSGRCCSKRYLPNCRRMQGKWRRQAWASARKHSGE